MNSDEAGLLEAYDDEELGRLGDIVDALPNEERADLARGTGDITRVLAAADVADDGRPAGALLAMLVKDRPLTVAELCRLGLAPEELVDEIVAEVDRRIGLLPTTAPSKLSALAAMLLPGARRIQGLLGSRLAVVSTLWSPAADTAAARSSAMDKDPDRVTVARDVAEANGIARSVSVFRTGDAVVLRLTRLADVDCGALHVVVVSGDDVRVAPFDVSEVEAIARVPLALTERLDALAISVLESGGD